MQRVIGLLVVAAGVLATIWAFNKFSGKNVSQLGSGT